MLNQQLINPANTILKPLSDAPPIYGKNPLIIAAEPLLMLVSQIRKTLIYTDTLILKEKLIVEMENFQKYLQQIRYDRRLTTAAHYCLCVTIDETVFKTNWGKDSSWMDEGLLSFFHKETWGGERFYIILRNAMENVKTDISLLELLYLCLSLGYEGQYHGQEQIIREEIRNKVFYYIHRYYGKQTRLLSPHWEDEQLIILTQQKKKSLKKRFFWSLGVFLVVIVSLNISFYFYSKNIIEQLNNMATESPVTLFSQLTHRN